MSRAQEVIEICHQNAHAADHDPEDYVFLSLTQREIWQLLLGLVLAALAYPCLEEGIVEHEQKVGGAIHAQKPHWRDEDEATSSP